MTTMTKVSEEELAAELLGRASGLFDTRPPAQHLHLHSPISDAEASQLAERARLRGRCPEDVDEG